MKKYVCQQCNKTFFNKHNNRKYCSRQCYGLAYQNKRKSTDTEFKKGHCFWLGKKRANMTGKNNPNYVKKISVSCITCRKKFEIIPSKIKGGRGKFCSKGCYYKNKKLQRGGNNRGGIIITEDGYRAIWCPEHPYAQRKGYILEHRLIMEQHLKRYLEPNEIVHHKDGNQENNALSNLGLFDNIVSHLKYHRKNGSYNYIDYRAISETRKRNFKGQFMP